jgi:hypothetical protein
MAMQLMMVVAAERHGEFVANLASEGSGLREFQMMGIAGRALTDQARLRCDKSQMDPVAASHRPGQRVTFSSASELWSGAAIIGVVSPCVPLAGPIEVDSAGTSGGACGPRFSGYSGIPSHKGAVGHVLNHYAPRRDNRSGASADAKLYNNAVRKPDLVADHDGQALVPIVVPQHHH